MRRVTWAEIRRRPTRLAGALLAVMISVGFVVACLTFVDTEAHAIRTALTARIAGSNVVVQPSDQKPITTQLGQIPGVDVVEASTNAYPAFVAADRSGRIELTSLPHDQRLRPSELIGGRWPNAADEIAITQATADAFRLSIGSTITVPSARGETAASVVGVTADHRNLFSELRPAGFSAPGSSLLSDGWVQYLVIAEAGTSPETLAEAIRQRLGDQVSVQTADEMATAALAELTDGVDIARILLLGFGGIALLVGAIIIATTFAVVVAQRRQQIGLLRALGADRRQIRVQLLVEATVTGLVGTGLGVALGIAATATAAAITGSLRSGLVLEPGGVGLAAGVGLVVTLIAALAPAHRAVRVSPLDALRPVADLATERRTGLLTAVAAALLIVAGVGVTLLAFQVPGHALLLAVVGSALLALGILTAAPRFLPPAFRLTARLLRHARPSVRLAAANLVRNPSRAATVAVALMLGVGLIVTLQVGAASVKASTQASVRSEFPVDLAVSADGPLPPTMIDQLRSTPGIRATIGVPEVDVDLGQAIGTVRVAGLGPDARTVVAAGLDALNDRTALVHPTTLEMIRQSDGDTLTLRYRGRAVTVELRASDVAAAFGSIVITQATLDRLAPGTPVRSVWAAAEPGADVVTLMSDVQTLVDRQPGVSVAGSLTQVAAITAVLDTLLAVATALTAVAVIIALIGMSTTLGLSVIERRRESAMLRALGLQRSQLQSMLAAEAVMLAAVGGLVGVAAGLLFGFVGATAMAVQADFVETRFAVSAPQIVAVVAVAVAAGALASILPGRRAAQALPVAALAEA